MSEQTIEKLKKMRLPIMAEEYQNQKDDPGYQNMTFEERLTLMVDREYDARINHTDYFSRSTPLIHSLSTTLKYSIHV